MMTTKTTQARATRRRRWWAWGLAVVVGLLIGDYFLYPLLPYGGRSLDRGENGLWLRYTWYFGQWQDADLNRICRRMRAGHIRDAYCHVRSILADGQLKYRYPEQVRKLVAALHRQAPGVRVFAWIYVGNARGLGEVDIANRQVRRRMVQEAEWLVRTCGFDGIQWDYEVCTNNNQGHLALLEETRRALPSTPLSVCAPMWYPTPVTHYYGWEDAYFTQVAARCDQLVIMGYDSAMYLPRAYAALLRQQVVRVSRAVARGNSRCRLLIGVPTYESPTPSHHPPAETLAMALNGVRKGVADARTDRDVFAGVALFAEYTTSVKEWKTYREMWVGGK